MEGSHVSPGTMLPGSSRDPRLGRALGAQIRTERERLAWSADDLAEIIGLDPPILELIEAGSLRPTPRQLIQIARALGVSLTRLFFPR